MQTLHTPNRDHFLAGRGLDEQWTCHGTRLPLDTRRSSYERFGGTYWTVANAVLVLPAGAQVLSLGKALGGS